MNLKSNLKKSGVFGFFFVLFSFVFSNPIAVDEVFPQLYLLPLDYYLVPMHIALSLTLVIELITGFVLGLRKRNDLIAIVGVNLATNPILNFTVIATGSIFWVIDLSGYYDWFIILLEIIVIVVEAALLWFALKKPLWKMIIFSFVMNAVSFIIGLILFA